MTSLTRPSDEQFSAWLDGELEPADRSAVDGWLREHPEDAALTRLWVADRDALRARLDPLLDEPLPTQLLQVLQQREAERPAANQPTWRRNAWAAGLLLTGGVLGALLGADAISRDPVSFANLPLPWRPAALVGASWPHRAAVAHAVYAPEVRHPVEVNVAQGSPDEQRAQEEHLARWLSKRLDMKVRLYDLRAQGFELVGGRLVPDLAGPGAQLMYQNAGGQRVTLYLRRPEAGADMSFRFQRDGDLNLVYWVEDGFGCALVGKLPREQLLALTDAVYKQAEGDIAPTPKPAS